MAAAEGVSRKVTEKENEMGIGKLQHEDRS